MGFKKIGMAAAVAAAAILVAAATAPLGVETVAFFAEGRFPDSNAAYAAYSALPGSLAEYLAEAASDKTSADYLLAWLGSIVAITAICAASMAVRRPGRIVKGGSPQGDARLIESPWEIDRKNDCWNGKGIPDSAGLVISGSKRRLLYDRTIPHWITVGITGSGKSQLMVIETVALCAAAGWNLIITGKEELVELTGDRISQLGYERIVLSLQGYPGSSRWNPIDLIADRAESGRCDEAQRLARQTAADLIPVQGETNPYFPKAARSILTGIILAVAYSEDAPREAKNMASVYEIITRGTTGDGKDPSAPLKGYIRSLGPDHPAYGPCSEFLSDNGTVAQRNVLSTLKEAITIFGDEGIRRMTSVSDVGIEEMLQGKSACYLHLLEQGDPYQVVFTCFFNQLWRVAQEIARGNHGQLPRETAIIADEFGNLNRIDAAPQITSLGRSLRLHLYAFVQNFKQLNCYNDPGDGGAGRDKLTGSMGGSVALALSNPEDFSHFTKLAGKRVVRARSTTDSRTSNMSRTSGESYGEVADDLIHEHEWQFRSPVKDGAIVVKTGTNSAPERAGVYRMPLDYAANTPAGPFFGLKGIEHDAAKREDFHRRMQEQERFRELDEVRIWVPEFPQEAEGGPCVDPATSDEMSFWD